MSKFINKTKAKMKRVTTNLHHAVLASASADFRQLVASPIFIVGCGHSGTTLLLRVVGSHPDVHPILDESQTFEKARLYKLKRFDLQAHQYEKSRWVEKTPRHILHIEDIFKARPKAKILLILRDGRDVAVSIRNRTGRLEDGIKRWIEDNREGEAWWDDSRVKVLQYEDLVEHFATKLNSMLQFLELPYSEDCLNFNTKLKHPEIGHQKPGSAYGENHLEYRMWQVTQPLFDGRSRWKKGMNEAEKKMFKERAGEILIRYGYETSMDW